MDLIWQAIGDAIRLIVHADAELMRIAGLSLLISGAATALAAAIGIPLGIASTPRMHTASRCTLAAFPAAQPPRCW